MDVYVKKTVQQIHDLFRTDGEGIRIGPGDRGGKVWEWNYDGRSGSGESGTMDMRRAGWSG